MTLEQLRIFVAVAEREHVTRAAQFLNLAQSAVSAAIAALEAQHATLLFNRVGRGIELTDAGRLFLDEARAVLGRAERAELALAELGSLRRGVLAIQASQTIAGYWLPRHLIAFHAAYPQIDIRLAIGNTSQAAKSVVEGVAELGFVEGDIDDPALSAADVARDRLIIVVGAQHPWAERASITPDELTQSEWIMREAGSGTRSSFEAAVKGFGLAPNQLRIALELPSNEAVRAAVESGAAAGALSASVAASGIEAGLLHHVALDLPERVFRVLWRRERFFSNAAETLLAMIGAATPNRRAA